QAEEMRAHFGVHRVEEIHQDQRWQDGRQAMDQLDENNKELNKTGARQKQAID
ncbi:hypothetical protein HX803_30025, partial [Pseudomonas sp. P7548]|nr:hypothetical protein [Pseudomonas sp. P7548]